MSAEIIPFPRSDWRSERNAAVAEANGHAALAPVEPAPPPVAPRDGAWALLGAAAGLLVCLTLAAPAIDAWLNTVLP